MLNTYHVSVHLNAAGGGEFNAIVIAENNHLDEASEEVVDFFTRHDITCDVIHICEVA